MQKQIVYGSVVIILSVCNVFGETYPQVAIPGGIIQGEYKTTANGIGYSSFTGIPYAKPPVADLRFEDPQPVAPWTGIWIANFSTTCIQVGHIPGEKTKRIGGSEDCLYMNVFVPGEDINPNNNYDVIIHIHGGAFMVGHGLMFTGPEYLIEKNVIFITFNYRVGIHGFLSTGDENLPGNYGMKDQVLALKWIKDNVKYFGGNSESITLTGLSAGGASVHLHYLSPLSKNLFTRGIATSGSALNPWVFQTNPLKQARKVAAAVGCNLESTAALAACLKQRNGEQINAATNVLRSWLSNPFSPLSIVVDNASQKPFLPKHPYEILRDGEVYDVPLISSGTYEEGLYPGAEFYNRDNCIDDLNKQWNKIAPDLLHYHNTITSKNSDLVSEKIREHYLGNDPISKNNYKKFVQLLGDRLFISGIELGARLHAKAVKSPVYFYHYNYTSEKVPSVSLLFSGEALGVSHGDDSLYIFSDTPGLPFKTEFSDSDRKVRNMFTNFWSSYASTGIPRNDWIPVSKNLNDPFQYLYIGSAENVENRSADELGHNKFWESLPVEENANIYSKRTKTEL